MAKKEIAVGIDIGATNTVFGFVDKEGNILGEGRIKTTQYGQIEVFVSVLYDTITIAGEKLENDFQLTGFGIGAPMGNINKGTIEHSAGLPWKGIVPLAEIFQPAYIPSGNRYKRCQCSGSWRNGVWWSQRDEKLCCNYVRDRSGQRICY